MASQQVDNYSTATPADADQAIGIDASDTTDSANGTVKRFILSDVFTYIKGKLLALANTWTATQSFSAVEIENTTPDATNATPLSVAHAITATPTSNAAAAGNFELHSTVTTGSAGYYLNGIGGAVNVSSSTTVAPAGLYGLNFAAKYSGPGTLDYLAAAYINTFTGGNGNVTAAYGLEIANVGIGGTGQIGTYYGIAIDAPFRALGNPKPTHAIALYVPDYSAAGATDAYAIYVEGGLSHLADLELSATKTANTVWAGPTTGAAAAPTWRALVAADIPSLSYASNDDAVAYALIFG